MIHSPCYASHGAQNRGTPAPRPHLGTEAVYRVCDWNDELAEVEVVQAPGLRSGQRFMFDVAAVRSMARVVAPEAPSGAQPANEARSRMVLYFFFFPPPPPRTQRVELADCRSRGKLGLRAPGETLDKIVRNTRNPSRNGRSLLTP